MSPVLILKAEKLMLSQGGEKLSQEGTSKTSRDRHPKVSKLMQQLVKDCIVTDSVILGKLHTFMSLFYILALTS